MVVYISKERKKNNETRKTKTEEFMIGIQRFKDRAKFLFHLIRVNKGGIVLLAFMIPTRVEHSV